MTDLPATRTAALAALTAFVPRAGRPYADLRNLDLGDHAHVSRLSPYLRHRLVTEAEVIAAVEASYPTGADKFLSEVYWRTYWKGWLELRPGVWADYRTGLRAALNRVATESGLRAEVATACAGETGIDAFDHWAREIVATGYLHNHARMWFASIWMFTLRLPWELGADFFLRHLLDGDPASNTLSWRWVGGLQTHGKTYLATADNIARNTRGRFAPKGLATRADPLPAQRPLPTPRPTPTGEEFDPSLPAALLITEEDLSPEFLIEHGLRPVAAALAMAPEGRSPLTVAPSVIDFTARALGDAGGRMGAQAAHFSGSGAVAGIVAWARGTGAAQVVTPSAPIGPAADLLAALAPDLAAAGIPLIRVLRPYDAHLWPHATRGFFPFREAAMG